MEFSEELKDNVRKVAQELGFDERKMRILETRCLGERTASLQELADEFGVTKERVRIIEGHIQRRIVSHLAKGKDEDERLAATLDALNTIGKGGHYRTGALNALIGTNHPLKGKPHTR